MFFLCAMNPASSEDQVGCETHSSLRTARHISSRPAQVTVASCERSQSGECLEGRSTHARRHPAVAPLLETRIHPSWANRDDHRAALALDPRPRLLLLTLLQHPSLPLPPVIPAKGFP